MSSTPRQPHGPVPAARRTWDPPRLKAVGTLGQILKGGTNKVTVVSGDPGEPVKPGPNDL